MDVRDLLRELGVPFYEHGQSAYVSAGWVGLICPWCGRGGKPGLGINTRTLATTCFKCGSHRLIDALAAASDRPAAEIARRLPGIDTGGPPADDLPPGRYTPPPGVGPLMRAHRDYLAGRGFDPDQIAQQWGVCGIGPAARLQWRLFIPAPDHRGRPASWTTRAVGEGVTPRYVSARPDEEAVPIRSTLYGEHLCRWAVVVVEGPTDAWRVGPGAVATLGVGFTPPQIVRLCRYPVRVICFDNDPGARRRAAALADRLAPFPGDTWVVSLSGPDPDTSPPAELAELRKRFLE